MSVAKIAISIDLDLLSKVDHFIRKRIFKNRSQAIQVAIRQKVEQMEHRRLAEECQKLDPAYEQKMADEWMTGDGSEWPKY